MKRILAIDLGATITGWADNAQGQPRCYTWPLFDQKAMKKDRDAGMDRFLDPRIPLFFKLFVNHCKTYGIELVVFEDVLFAKSLAQGQLWASLRGALWVGCNFLDIPARCVPVQTIKKHATGHGGASKAAMILAARGNTYDDNAADALAILNYALAVERGECQWITASIKRAKAPKVTKGKLPEGFGAVSSHLPAAQTLRSAKGVQKKSIFSSL